MQITDTVKKTEVRNIKERTEGERLGESKTTIGYKPYTPEMKKFIIPPNDGYQAYLEKVYIKIREAGLDDIPIIAKNTGLDEQELIKLKEHIFLNTHNLSVDGKALKELYFQADSEIAYAWEQAMKGELSLSQKKWFQQLINHELTERLFMEQGMPLRDPSTYGNNGFNVDPMKNAHDRANITAPQPGDYPGHDGFSDFMKHMDEDLDY